MKRLITSSLLAGSMLVLAFGEASALDQKIKAGAECVRTGGGTPTVSAGALQNAHMSSTMYVECPILRDAGGIKGIQQAKVRVLDNHPSLSVKCRLRTAYRTSDGSMVVRSSKAEDSSQNGTDTLIFPKRVDTHYSCTEEIRIAGRVVVPQICSRSTETHPAVWYTSLVSHAYIDCSIPSANGREQLSSVDSYLYDEN
jgi:hypothetical protein